MSLCQQAQNSESTNIQVPLANKVIFFNMSLQPRFQKKTFTSLPVDYFPFT